MKRTVVLILAILTICVSCSTYEIPSLIQDPPAPVTDYPMWYIPQIEMVHAATPGTHYKWLLTYKNSSHKDKYPDSALFVIPAVKGHSFEIRVNSNRGNPVIMIWDRLIHKNDAYAIINGYQFPIQLPGNPLALEIGENGQTSLCFTPKKNGILNAWLWILNGDYEDPGPFEAENYDNSVYDTLEVELTDSYKSSLILMDSLDHVDQLSDVWNNRVTNKRNFNRAKVDIYINNGNCTSVTHTDYYQRLLAGVDTLGTLLTLTGRVNSLADMQKWYTLNDKLDSLKSISFRNNRQMSKNGIILRSEPFDITLESRWDSWTNHPTIQAALSQRDEIYRTFPGEVEASDLFRMRFSYKEGELGFLKSSISMLLAQTVSKLNGISGAIYDNKGYLVAASQPFTFMNIFQDANWNKIQNIQERFSSDCYRRTGYNFDVKKVFIPIKGRQDLRNIGWLMVEIYCK